MLSNKKNKKGVFMKTQKRRGRPSLLDKMENNKSKITIEVSDKTKYLLLFMAKLQRKSVDTFVEETVMWATDFYMNGGQWR
jgi:predicted HicB family RNase H-like nuclease